MFKLLKNVRSFTFFTGWRNELFTIVGISVRRNEQVDDVGYWSATIGRVAPIRSVTPLLLTKLLLYEGRLSDVAGSFLKVRL